MSDGGRSVSIVTQTCVRPEHADDFARWQGETSDLISKFPGFIEQQLIPPKPPLQEDWVILQRFHGVEDAKRWLASPERQHRIEGAAPMLLGRTDVHIVQDEAGAVRSAPASAVISTRVKPGKEAEYRAWERKIATAQSKAPGLQGYRFDPAIPGVQEDCVAILRFDTEKNLRAWLDSPERKALVAESAPLVEEFHARMVNTGFEQWFREVGAGGAPLPVWKMNMIVLLLLYPIVFLWGFYVGTPFLDKAWHLPWAINLFIGNIFSVGMTGFLVPWTANNALAWWLRPKTAVGALGTHLLGAAIILAIYLAMVMAFWRLF
jgi:antibiotic biosynthesis monooxygenase (ABM) superfamily enzyme